MKIVCFTGTRADYGIYRPLLIALAADPAIDLKLVVTGMHLVSRYGNTIAEIEQDGMEIIATPSTLFEGDTTLGMAQSVGVSVMYFADVLQFHRPDFVLLLGDRGEMLAAAISAHYQNMAIAHLHGGEISGSADDAVRHCISKLAHVHFVSCRHAQSVLEHTGEESWRICLVGSLRKSEISRVKKWSHEKRTRMRNQYNLEPKRRLLLFVMHPDSKEKLSFATQIGEALEALSSFRDLNIIAIGSNSDAGGQRFRLEVERFVRRHPHAAFYSSVPSDDYLYLMSEAALMVGNSSSGIIEAPFFQLPFIHIGRRQQNRAEGGNVIHVSYDAKTIRHAIQSVLNGHNSDDMHNPYDVTDDPAQAIIRRLKSLPDPGMLLNKILQF